MEQEPHRSALTEARDVVVTPHALERGYTEDELRAQAEELAGSIYLDTDRGTYHLVGEDTVLVLDVREGTRIVVTAYPRGESPRYQLDRFILIRG